MLLLSSYYRREQRDREVRFRRPHTASKRLPWLGLPRSRHRDKDLSEVIYLGDDSRKYPKKSGERKREGKVASKDCFIE